MFSGASNFAEGVDRAFALIFSVSIFFLLGITIIMIIFVVRYSRKKHPKAVQFKDSNLLEITWFVVPLILVMIMFWYGFVAYKPMRKVPEGAMEVKAVARMWDWNFEYPGGKQSPILVVPLNKAVKLDLVALDVIHSLYIPAFRIKEDMVPGKENYMWFIPEKLGEYDILCAEYCGVRHSYMESKVRVVSEEEYKTWLENLAKKPAEPEGLTILKNNGCIGCHSIDGSKLVSSSFKGLYGAKRDVEENGDDKTVKVDDEYITTSIYDPNGQIVKGYSKGIMKSYKSVLGEKDITKIIDYLKVLK